MAMDKDCELRLVYNYTPNFLVVDLLEYRLFVYIY